MTTKNVPRHTIFSVYNVPITRSSCETNVRTIVRANFSISHALFRPRPLTVCPSIECARNGFDFYHQIAFIINIFAHICAGAWKFLS